MYYEGGALKRYKKPIKCSRCGKYKRELFEVDGELICLDCLRGIAFYHVLSEGIKDPKLRGDVFKVLTDISALVLGNPRARAWLWPLNLWIYSHYTGETLTVEKMRQFWRFKAPLDEVIGMYIDLKIFKIIEDENGEKIITEGEALQEMLQKYRGRADLYDIVTDWAIGILITKLHEIEEAPDFRYVYAVLRMINNMIADDGGVRNEPYYRTIGYVCKLCGKKADAKEDMRRHLMFDHIIPETDVDGYVEEERVLVGYLLEVQDVIKAARKEYIKPEYLIERIEKYGAVVNRDVEINRVIKKNGRRYLVVSPSWVRIMARTREYERGLLRGRYR